MCVKAPRGLSHDRRLCLPETWTARLVDGWHELGERRGVLLVQPPPDPALRHRHVAQEESGSRWALSRLHDVGQIQRVQRQPYSVYPQSLVLRGDHPYDETDALAAAVCST